MNQFRHAASPPLTPGASLLGSRDFLHLWAVGGIANGMRWLEVLAAALFTLEVTGSPLAVAAVTAARTLPLIVIGGFAGVLADAAGNEVRLRRGEVRDEVQLAPVRLQRRHRHERLRVGWMRGRRAQRPRQLRRLRDQVQVE